MLLRQEQRLEEIIVRILAEETSLQVSALEKRIRTFRSSFTTQAVYKELAKLRKLGVVVKNRKEYSLSLAWILDISDFAERIHNVYLEQEYLNQILPGEGEKNQWTFTNLVTMDDFWNQLILSLLNQSKTEVMFEWIPHPWFLLIHHEKERDLMNAIKIAGKKMYICFGGDSYLDRLADKAYSKDVYICSYAPGPFETQRSLYIDVIDDYILTIRLNKSMSERIERLYESVESAEDLDIPAVIELLTGSSRIKVALENNPRKAKRLQKKFSDYFGLAVRAFRD